MDDSDTSFIPHGGAWKRPVLLSDSESDTDTTESAETSLGDQDDSLFVVNSVASSSPVSTVKAPTKKRGNVARKIIESDSDEPSDDDDLLQPSALTPQKLSPKLNYSPPPEATTTTSTTTTDSPDSLSDLLGSLTIQPSPDPNWVAQSSGPHPYYSLSSSPTTSPFIPPLSSPPSTRTRGPACSGYTTFTIMNAPMAGRTVGPEGSSGTTWGLARCEQCGS